MISSLELLKKKMFLCRPIPQIKMRTTGIMLAIVIPQIAPVRSRR